MTRRHLIDLLLAGPAGTLGCTPAKSGILSALNETVRSESLVLIDAAMPDYVTAIGAGAGRLVVPDRPRWLSISPDGGWQAGAPAPRQYRTWLKTGVPFG
jgi:hypothetical protein